MRTYDLENDLELQRILWSCYVYDRAEPLPPEERVICYSWVFRMYQSRFATGFHPLRLHALADLGLLEKCDSSRGGRRRYYKVHDRERVEALLSNWSLN